MSSGAVALLAKRACGRPRSVQARQAILEATARLLAATPLKLLAIENIAREAGVGKATIYRWWPNKAAIVIDAFFEEVEPRTAFEKAPTAAEAIRNQAMRMVHVIGGPIGRIAAQIIAEGQSDPSVIEHFRARFLRRRRAAATEIIKTGIANGEFRDDLDIELAIDLIYGPIWYRLLVGHQPLDAHFAEQLPKLGLAILCKGPKAVLKTNAVSPALSPQ
ncbi:MAG: TetR/AcrR family transcriptional regulator [Gammaproteobacteria bacterium]